MMRRWVVERRDISASAFGSRLSSPQRQNPASDDWREWDEWGERDGREMCEEAIRTGERSPRGSPFEPRTAMIRPGEWWLLFVFFIAIRNF